MRTQLSRTWPYHLKIRGGGWDISQDPIPASAMETPVSRPNDIGFRTFRLGRRVLRKVLT